MENAGHALGRVVCQQTLQAPNTATMVVKSKNATARNSIGRRQLNRDATEPTQHLRFVLCDSALARVNLCASPPTGSCMRERMEAETLVETSNPNWLAQSIAAITKLEVVQSLWGHHQSSRCSDSCCRDYVDPLRPF